MINREDLSEDGFKQSAKEGLRQAVMRSLQMMAGEDRSDEFYDAAIKYVLAMSDLKTAEKDRKDIFDAATEILLLNKIDLWANDAQHNIEDRKKKAEIIKTCLIMASYILTENHHLIYKNAVKLDSLVNSYTR